MLVTAPFSYLKIPWEARRQYLRDINDAPSDRRIISIVKATPFPETPLTSAVDLQGLSYINPATNGYSVHGNTSGRAEKRVNNCYDRVIWQLPGHGPVGNPENCGVMHGAEACADRSSDKIVYRPKRWYCDRPTCPHCFEQWTKTVAAKKSMLLEGARQLFGFYGSSYRLCHVIISVPSESYKGLGMKKGYDMLKENLLRTCDYFDMHGLSVFHPFRGKKDLFTDSASVLDADAMADTGLLDDYWRWGPHFHCVAFCDPHLIRDRSTAFYSLYGYVVKVIADDLDVSDAQNVIEYVLSHAGIGKWEGHRDIRAIFPFGKLATSKRGGVAKLCGIDERVSLRCSECGGFLYDTRELDAGVIDELSMNNTVVLHHAVYVRREELPGYQVLIEGMDDNQLIDFAHKSYGDVALVYDPRQTEIEAECDISLLVSAPLLWSPPPRAFKGQTSLYGGHTQRAPGPPSLFRRASSELSGAI